MSNRAKNLYIAIAILTLISICLPVLLSNRSSGDFARVLLPNRPSRDLDTITKEINAREAREKPAAEAAVRQYGTNLLPQLLSLLVARDSAVQQALARTPILGAYLQTDMDKREF